MKKTEKKIRLLFWFSLGLSIGFPLGVLGIIFGAIDKIIPLLVGGIVFTVAGFYVMPILWVQYGEKRRDRRFLRMIEEDHLYTVQELAQQMGFTEQVTRDRIKRLIMSQELVGYLLVGDVLELNTNVKQTAKTRRTQKCEQCGALMPFDGVKFVCEYCGNVVGAADRH